MKLTRPFLRSLNTELLAAGVPAGQITKALDNLLATYGLDTEVDTRDSQLAFFVLNTQASLSQTRAMFNHARIVSGAYKSGRIRMGGSDGPFLTEEELLQHELGIMNTHIRNAQETLDLMMEKANG